MNQDPAVNYLYHLRATLVRWAYESQSPEDDNTSVLIKDTTEGDMFDVLMAAAKAVEDLHVYRCGAVEWYRDKPSWGAAPAWAGWLCQDKDGSWWWHEAMPDDGCDSWLGEGKRLLAGPPIEWRFTLESKP